MDILLLFSKFRSVCKNAICEIILIDDFRFTVKWTWRIKKKGQQDLIAYIDQTINYLELQRMGVNSIDPLLDEIRFKIAYQTRVIIKDDNDYSYHEAIKILFGSEHINDLLLVTH